MPRGVQGRWSRDGRAWRDQGSQPVLHACRCGRPACDTAELWNCGTARGRARCHANVWVSRAPSLPGRSPGGPLNFGETTTPGIGRKAERNTRLQGSKLLDEVAARSEIHLGATWRQELSSPQSAQLHFATIWSYVQAIFRNGLHSRINRPSAPPQCNASKEYVHGRLLLFAFLRAKSGREGACVGESPGQSGSILSTELGRARSMWGKEPNERSARNIDHYRPGFGRLGANIARRRRNSAIIAETRAGIVRFWHDLHTLQIWPRLGQNWSGIEQTGLPSIKGAPTSNNVCTNRPNVVEIDQIWPGSHRVWTGFGHMWTNARNLGHPGRPNE